MTPQIAFNTAYHIAAPLLPSFARRDPIDLLAIVGSKVNAVIKRLQAIFDCRNQLLDIPHDHRLALQHIGDRLEWILDNIKENGTSWTRSQQQNIDWFCSCYAPLAEDDFESEDPGPHTHPAPSLAHTRPASPTATLQVYPEIQWIYAGVEYDSLENAIRALANSLGITNPAYVDWTISVTRDITWREIVNVYNVLGSKIYEHRNDFLNESDTTHATFKELDTSMTGLHTKADTAGNLALKVVEENKQLRAELVTVNADLEVLNRNNTELVKRYKELAAKFTQLEQGLSTRTTPGISTAPVPVVSQASRIKASEPPKYKGKKGSDITLEQWLQKMGLWFRVQNITTDDDKITLALMYLEGGAHDYVEDYVETASNGGTLGSWTNFVN
ncbi:hypothetical protein DICSQDRAFT_166235 [Dichomitus squalens LYAD-421 SS1]|uniref:uncharacterized protein n=1 Tax=Dichomitus squalens (strain LYAD-421) TaxID=732165 RepID=UPI00044151DB|nr:uncharacterized protein DICSQDRAFT_166235 [Dichomitus squalens LYAD-421 SS1]EJF65184.1 hypothetical protein DICSQDRAFT_166235 [Dichomitus squalens LYAD-421 SS1]